MLAENTLLKTAYHFLLLLVGFDTLTYRKDYDRSPTLVGHQESFLAPLLGSEALLVRKILYYALKFIVTCYYGKKYPLRGLFGVSSPRAEPQLVTPQPTAPTENIGYEIP